MARRSYSEQVRQRIIKPYERSGKSWPATAHEIAEWALQNRLWDAHPSIVLNQCADEIARAMREEVVTDPQGRRVRAKHVANIRRDGKQLPLWDDIRRADREHMQIAFQQRRQQIVGDCRQLKVDVDSYNDNRNRAQPIQMIFDFTLDLAELEAAA